MALERSSGLLLHITSLPSYGGVGDFGPAAFAFADFLASAKQKLWQVLPLNPTGYGNSPYAAMSAFAGNPLLVSLEYLTDWGWIAGEKIANLRGRDGNVDFYAVELSKLPLLHEAAKNFLESRPQDQWQEYESFCKAEAAWLDDYCAYAVLRDRFKTGAWHTWPEEFRKRKPEAMARLHKEAAQQISEERVIQFAFERQWQALRHYANEKGIRIVGDVAIFVNYDSADVWMHPDMFELDKELNPLRVAGVPPDYFSKTGQRWGNPLYRWDKLKAEGFEWWIHRIGRAKAMYDILRLDHFRGFEAYWAIPAQEQTAVNGEWVKGPGEKLFARLNDVLDQPEFIAEDLGFITPEVEALRERFNMPGMRILQFGFGNRGAHNYLPHKYDHNTVVYTGTHDNNTTRGWWEHDATAAEKDAVAVYTGPVEQGVVWPLIRLAATSVADVCLFPVQDILELGGEGRMNTPSQPDANWTWRCPEGALTPQLAEKLARLMEVSDRDVPPKEEKEEG